MALAYTPKRMYLGTMAATDATLYTAPALTPGAIIKQIVIVNTDTVARTVSLALNGTAATVANCALAQALNVLSKQTVTLDLSQVLNSGDTIHGLASAATAINVLISGVE